MSPTTIHLSLGALLQKFLLTYPPNSRLHGLDGIPEKLKIEMTECVSSVDQKLDEAWKETGCKDSKGRHAVSGCRPSTCLETVKGESGECSGFNENVPPIDSASSTLGLPSWCHCLGRLRGYILFNLWSKYNDIVTSPSLSTLQAFLFFL